MPVRYEVHVTPDATVNLESNTMTNMSCFHRSREMVNVKLTDWDVKLMVLAELEAYTRDKLLIDPAVAAIPTDPKA